MKTSIIIPARLESTRFPRKMLAKHNGKTLIQYTYENAQKSGFEVIVATDSNEIAETVRAFNGEIIMTSHCDNGSDRVAMAASNINSDVIINVQGDEPEVDPADLKRLSHQTILNPMATLITALDPSDADDRNIVKAVIDETTPGGTRAIFFSRFPMASSPRVFYQHIGVYAYQKDILLKISNRKPIPLEKVENLEQMRPLVMGIKIVACLTMFPTNGIDTEDDFTAFINRL